MNNSLNQWHNEQMVRYEMQQVDRAVEQARLLREAGLSNPSWLMRALKGLGNLLKARSKGVQARQPMEPQAYSRKNPRSA